MLCPRLGAGTAVGSVAVDFIVMANLRVVWIFSSLWDLLNLPDLGPAPGRRGASAVRAWWQFAN